MAEAIGWMSENWMLVVGTASTLSVGASLMVKAIAPLTKTTADDRAAAWLEKAHKWLSAIALNPRIEK